MPGIIDQYALERKIGRDAAVKLRVAFKLELQKSGKVTSGGATSKATVISKLKQQRLDRLTFSAPHYQFKRNYGFEGTKRNGVNMRLAATGVLTKAINNSQVLETLADQLADLRSEQVLTAINFGPHGR